MIKCEQGFPGQGLSYRQLMAVKTIQALQGAIAAGRWGQGTGELLQSNLKAFWASLEADDRCAIWEAGRADATLLSASQAVGQLPKGAG
jgi:hypothetical protein